jgi:hypothetical protein
LDPDRRRVRHGLQRLSIISRGQFPFAGVAGAIGLGDLRAAARPHPRDPLAPNKPAHHPPGADDLVAEKTAIAAPLQRVWLYPGGVEASCAPVIPQRLIELIAGFEVSVGSWRQRLGGQQRPAGPPSLFGSGIAPRRDRRDAKAAAERLDHPVAIGRGPDEPEIGEHPIEDFLFRRVGDRHQPRPRDLQPARQ